MARIRDHKAENARRNELARLRGESNRYQQRRKIETGKLAALQPKRVRSAATRKAQEALFATAPRRRDFTAPGVVLPVITDADRAQDWSDMFARAEVGKYRPEDARGLGMTKREYTQAYLRAFVIGDGRYYKTRHNKAGGSPHLYYWFVTMYHYYSADEYEASYGPAS